jgi:DNA-binding LacI/PurR family transcriptional regulator/DNA-binding transcriptional regulator YhcF (GntR family)
MAGEFEVKHPLPRRRAHQALRDQLIDYLIKERPKVGERFLSDHQLVRVSKLSRPTVRRALDDLSREGWIERRHGLGTFVGPRLALPTHEQVPISRHKRVGRVAVLVHLAGVRPFDWMTSGVLDGMDEVAAGNQVTIELLGSRDVSSDGIAKRLEASRPDALVAISPRPEQAFLLAEVRRMGIPVLLTGSRLLSLGLPTVREDGAQGSKLAVRHLFEHGHRRIGFIQLAIPTHWVFERREGYVDGLRDCGITPDENLVCWTGPEFSPQIGPQLMEYLRQKRPTAVVVASGYITRALRAHVERGELAIPGDLSLVTFDQMWGQESWVGEGKPVTIAQPLQEMGRRLVEMVRQVIDGRSAESPSPLPCSLIAGTTVRPISATGGNGAKGMG